MAPFYIRYWCPNKRGWMSAGEPDGYQDLMSAANAIVGLQGMLGFQTSWFVSDYYGNTVYQA